MSTERPSKRIRIDSAARPFEERFSGPSLTSPLPMAVDSNRDNDIMMVGVDEGPR